MMMSGAGYTKTGLIKREVDLIFEKALVIPLHYLFTAMVLL